jgi:hypothetical protein
MAFNAMSEVHQISTRFIHPVWKAKARPVNDGVDHDGLAMAAKIERTSDRL